jgi:hypothetical protein
MLENTKEEEFNTVTTKQFHFTTVIPTVKCSPRVTHVCFESTLPFMK